MKKISRELKYVWLCLIMITISGCGDKEGKGLGLDPVEGGSVGVPHELAGTYIVSSVFTAHNEDPVPGVVIIIGSDGSFSADQNPAVSTQYEPKLITYKSVKEDPSTLNGDGYVYAISGKRKADPGPFTSHVRYVKKGKDIYRFPQGVNSTVADVSGKLANEQFLIGQ